MARKAGGVGARSGRRAVHAAGRETEARCRAQGMTRRRKKTWRTSAVERFDKSLAALPLPPAGSPASDLLRRLGVDVDRQRAAQDEARERSQRLTPRGALGELHRIGGEPPARTC